MERLSLFQIIDELSLTYHLANAPLGIIIFNNHQEIIYWSERATEIFEWTAQEALNQSLTSLHIIHEEDAKLVAGVLDEIKKGGASRNQSSNRNYTKSGKVVFCEWYNSALKDEENVISTLSIVQDITERKIAGQALKKSREQLSLIYNSAIDPMWLINVEGPETFRFEKINSSFTEKTGLPKEKVIGFSIEEVLHPDSHEFVRSKYKEAVNKGHVINYVETIQLPAGEKIGEIRIVPVKNERGKVTKLVGFANDITEEIALRKKLDKEREEFTRKITSAVTKSQEMERSKVGRELHDNVNQVLTTVKLYIELCMDGSVDHHAVLPKCALLLNETISEIRDLSRRLSAPSLGDTGIKETINDLVQSVQITKGPEIHLDTRFVACDCIDDELHLAVYRIAQEHLTNILKHAQAGQVTIKLKVTQSRLSLEIKDDGRGFNTQEKTNGIGITNMKTRAHILKGSFKMESAKGKGTRLWVSFPIRIVDGMCYPVIKKSAE